MKERQDDQPDEIEESSPSSPRQLPDGPVSDPTQASEESELDDVDVRELLRAAMKSSPVATRDLTRGVQDRIRRRSKGRYYSDGWSRSTAPLSTFLVTSVLMLVVVIAAWILLGPIQILK